MPPRPRRPVIIEDETIAHSRALTDSTKRITLAASGLSFRSYNELYEKWLKNRYRDDIKPFTTHSPHVYDPYITEHGLSMVLDMDRATTSLAEELERDANEEGFVQAFAQLWREMGKQKREEMVLTVWEDQCRRAEKGEYIWAREDTPELTLNWATGDAQDGTPNWIKLWLNQAQTEEEKRRSRKDKDALPYLNLRNDKWDRANGVFEIEKSLVPVRKSIRAFVHDGIARRNYHLRQFVQELFCVLVSEPLSLEENYSGHSPDIVFCRLKSIWSRLRKNNLKSELTLREKPVCLRNYSPKGSVSEASRVENMSSARAAVLEVRLIARSPPQVFAKLRIFDLFQIMQETSSQSS